MVCPRGTIAELPRWAYPSFITNKGFFTLWRFTRPVTSSTVHLQHDAICARVSRSASDVEPLALADQAALRGRWRARGDDGIAHRRCRHATCEVSRSFITFWDQRSFITKGLRGLSLGGGRNSDRCVEESSQCECRCTVWRLFPTINRISLVLSVHLYKCTSHCRCHGRCRAATYRTGFPSPRATWVYSSGTVSPV